MTSKQPGQPQVLARWIESDPAVIPGWESLVRIHDGPVAHVVLNRPEKRNSMSVAMWTAITPLMGELQADPGVKLVVFRGAGTEAFSAGADISEFATVYADAQQTSEYNDAVQRAQLAVERFEKPTLAVVHGVCVGGGCGLALCCDIRFAAGHARFGITASKLGVAYSVPDTRRLVALVGPSRAKDILFSGRLLDATEALGIGMVDRVVGSSELESVAAAYARLLLTNSLDSICTAKAIINSLSGVHAQPERLLTERFAASFASDHFKEGYSAFVEKRKPKFS